MSENPASDPEGWQKILVAQENLVNTLYFFSTSFKSDYLCKRNSGLCFGMSVNKLVPVSSPYYELNNTKIVVCHVPEISQNPSS